MLDGLTDSGLACETAADGPDARVRLRDSGPFDLILLDVMMPGQTGWSLLDEIRAAGDLTPVIFLTARHEIEERVRGLRAGADDYILKPFDFKELLARVEAVQRRRGPGTLSIGPLTIELETRIVKRAGARIDLTQREYEVLLALVRARGRVLSREDLLRDIWDMNFDPETNLVNVVVSRLRRKLGRGQPTLIRTIVGEGYMIPTEAR